MIEITSVTKWENATVRSFSCKQDNDIYVITEFLGNENTIKRRK